MRSSLILTIVGPDRPGLVEVIASTLAAHGGNWEQSRMAHLAGQFAGILRISAPKERLPQLQAALEGLTSRGLRVVSVHGEEAERPSARSLRLELTGTDREGIVREIASALAAREVNVDELETSHESAPMAGNALFHASAHLRVPAHVDMTELRDTLEAIGDDLMVDLTLE